MSTTVSEQSATSSWTSSKSEFVVCADTVFVLLGVWMRTGE